MGKTQPRQTEPRIADAYRQRKIADPGARSRDIADELGVSEGFLAEARRGADVERLALRGAECVPFLEDLRAVGPVMALTRNDTAVHETTGPIDAVSHHKEMGQIVGPIDLRLFLRHWSVVFSIVEETRSGLRHSVQVFDSFGAAVIKIYATSATDLAIWDRIVSAAVDRSDRIATFAPALAPADDPADADIDAATLREGWLALEHTHDFFKLLNKVGAGREQSLRLVGDDLATRTDAGIVERVLTAAAAGAVPIMCFVGNPGCLQIFSGSVERVVPMGPWINVMDPDFNLHLRTDRVAGAWVVRKPTSLRGLITSIELFDDARRLVCQFFGARPPGEGENPAWRTLVEQSLEV